MNGSLLFWADVQVEPTFDEKEGMRIFFDDRKVHKETEVQLRRSEEKYRTIFENIQDVYFEISMNGRILLINKNVPEKQNRGA